MILRNFISLRAFTVYMETHCGLKFHFSQFDRSEICTEVSFTTPKVMWTLTMKLPQTEVKFYPEVKSQTGLSSLRVSCKRPLKSESLYIFAMEHLRQREKNEMRTYLLCMKKGLSSVDGKIINKWKYKFVSFILNLLGRLVKLKRWPIILEFRLMKKQKAI